MLPDLDSLALFVKAAETRNLTRAAHKLMGDGERARTAFDFRPPAAIPLYRGNPWFMPAVIQGYGLLDRMAWWRAKR